MESRVHTQTKAEARPSSTPIQRGLLQRKCACGGAPGVDGECAACRKRRLQRQPDRQVEPTGVPAIVHDVLRSPGQPLDPATRAFMEPRFGHDFSAVRVHTDLRAAESARAVNALAYTVGRDVTFGPGQYAPGTSAGRRLIAHELAHVVQQGDRPGSVAGLALDSPVSESEQACRAGRQLGWQPASTRTSLTAQGRSCSATWPHRCRRRSREPSPI